MHHIIKWQKDFTYTRGKSIVLEENYLLSENNKAIETAMMTCRKPKILDDGMILLPSYKGEDRQVSIKYDKKLFNAEIETYPLEDRKLMKSWENGELYRIKFTMKNKALSGKIKWTIELI